MKSVKPVSMLLLAQGIYFTITGVWPFIHLNSFLLVTGPKNDIWLLKTVSVLIIAVGVSLTVAGLRREYNAALFTLALTSAFGLMAIDVYYAVNDVIWDVYLLDAVAEAGLILSWIIILFKEKRPFVTP